MRQFDRLIRVVAVLAIFGLASCGPLEKKESVVPLAPIVQEAPSAPTVPQIVPSAETVQSPALPTVQPVETTTAPSGPTPVTTVETTKFTAPTITDKYPLVQLHFGMMRPLALSPGKIWAGTGLGLVDVFDSKDGHLIQSIALFPDAKEKADSLIQSIASSKNTNEMLSNIMPALKLIDDLGFDGKNIWAVASWIENHSSAGNHVYVIDPSDGKIIKQWDSSRWQNPDLEPGMFPAEDDMKLGFSPGKVWVMGKVIDTATFGMEDFMTSSKMVDYAYDGKGWMWMSQLSPVEHHEDLVAYNVDKPDDYRHPKYNPAYSFKIGGGDPIAVADGKLWDASEETLLALPADGGKFATGFNAIELVPMGKGSPEEMLFDGHYLWLLKSDETNTLYQIDPSTGKTLFKLDVTGDPDSMPPDLPNNIAFDGHDLWLLSTISFSRIELPYME